MPVTIGGGLRMEDEKETLVPMNPNYLILNCHLNIICYHKIVLFKFDFRISQFALNEPEIEIRTFQISSNRNLFCLDGIRRCHSRVTRPP